MSGPLTGLKVIELGQLDAELPGGTQMPVPGIAPKHTEEILGAAGYSADDVADLRRRAIV